MKRYTWLVVFFLFLTSLGAVTLTAHAAETTAACPTTPAELATAIGGPVEYWHEKDWSGGAAVFAAPNDQVYNMTMPEGLPADAHLDVWDYDAGQPVSVYEPGEVQWPQDNASFHCSDPATPTPETPTATPVPPTATNTPEPTATSTALPTATATITPTATALPDLIAEISVEPAHPSAGDTADIVVMIKNVGRGDAGGFRVKLYVNPTIVPPTNDTPSTSQTYDGMGLQANGGWFEWSLIGYEFDADNAQIYVRVDSESQVVEANEENNLAFLQVVSHPAQTTLTLVPDGMVFCGDSPDFLTMDIWYFGGWESLQAITWQQSDACWSMTRDWDYEGVAGVDIATSAELFAEEEKWYIDDAGYYIPQTPDYPDPLPTSFPCPRTTAELAQAFGGRPENWTMRDWPGGADKFHSDVQIALWNPGYYTGLLHVWNQDIGQSVPVWMPGWLNWPQTDASFFCDWSRMVPQVYLPLVQR